jgi:hypothetical protein
MEWGQFFEVDANRVVGYTEITSKCYVSTVFLGLDHRHRGIQRDGPPLVFETMIFDGPDEIAGWGQRYSSWDDAEIGHKAAVRVAREAVRQKTNG